MCICREGFAAAHFFFFLLYSCSCVGVYDEHPLLCIRGPSLCALPEGGVGSGCVRAGLFGGGPLSVESSPQGDVPSPIIVTC